MKSDRAMNPTDIEDKVRDLESWKVYSESKVATKRKDGSDASLLGDSFWDVSAYGSNNPLQRVHFRRSPGKEILDSLDRTSRAQAQQVMYFLMHEVSDEVPAIATLKGQIQSIRDFWRFTYDRGMTLYEGFQSVETITLYIQQEHHENKSQRLHAILANLNRIGRHKTKIEIDLPTLHKRMMARFMEREQHRQHPVIPTRIYSIFLRKLESELSILESTADDLIQVLSIAYSDSIFKLSLPSAVEDIFHHYNRNEDAGGLSGLLNDIAVLCETIIIAFSGMRAKEGSGLPFNCLRPFVQDGVEHFAIEGVTTKFSGGREARAFWITSRLGARAVRLAQRIFGVVHAHFDGNSFPTSFDGSHLLFCRTGLAGSAYTMGRGIGGKSDYFDALKARLAPKITEEDLEELAVIDPFRAWEEESEFAVGGTWPLTRHQFRRSLALYAQRSGLVTLPSLKRQLHHITMEMATYYGNGSAFAKDILSINKKHFAGEWREASPVSQYLAYAAQVVFTDERLFGGHASWVTARSSSAAPVSNTPRPQTIGMFKRGQLAYKETVLGGCTATGKCRSSPLNWLPRECLEGNCKDLVVSDTKLQNVIFSQTQRVEKLKVIAADSVEYRMEFDLLNVLKDFQFREVANVEKKSA